jgi:hypothetical protein
LHQSNPETIKTRGVKFSLGAKASKATDNSAKKKGPQKGPPNNVQYGNYMQLDSEEELT